MASELERTRFWGDTGSSVAVFDNDEVDAIFVEAGETYTDPASIVAQTRIIAIGRLFASAAKLTDYTQNASQEKQSQVFDHLKELLKLWEGRLDTAVTDASTLSAARFGGLRRKPKRITERPGDY